MKTVILIGNELRKVSLSEAMDNLDNIQFTGTENQCDAFMSIAQ